MIETEPKWLNYEFEQAQVQIDVGDMILEQLVNETISILNAQAERDFDSDLQPQEWTDIYAPVVVWLW